MRLGKETHLNEYICFGSLVNIIPLNPRWRLPHSVALA